MSVLLYSPLTITCNSEHNPLHALPRRNSMPYAQPAEDNSPSPSASDPGVLIPRNSMPRVNNDPRHFDEYLTMHYSKENLHGLFDCFADCPKARYASKGFRRRGNLWAHLRDYHEQVIPLGG